jgi:hypothetical protein
MLQKMRVLLFVCVTAVLAACGGGGGGDETPNFAGTYRVSTSLTTNNCNVSVSASILTQDTATQNGRAMSINSAGMVFNGSVDADNGGFSVSNTTVSSGVPVVSTIAFRTAAVANTYAANVSVSASSGGATCVVIYTGTATRS